mmetsp:Transcript_4063/g.8347  ORF Transcript_4063/g.8347 Transcript_4063/m.8347 type:complete len:246 (+) Transcript_4063:92-829(+)
MVDRRNGKALRAIVLLAAVACLLFTGGLDSLRSSSSIGFVPAPGADAGRRQALSALLPVSTAVIAAAPALAADAPAAPPAPPKNLDVKFDMGAFTLPASMGFGLVKVEGQPPGSRFYSQKDKGAIVYCGPTWDLKALANDLATPSLKGPTGVQFLNYKISANQDDLEYIELPISDTQNAEGPYTYIFGGKSRQTKFHYWMRNVKQGDKASVMMIGYPMETLLPIDYKKEKKEEDLLRGVLSSFKV